jgi:hypothetical protein
MTLLYGNKLDRQFEILLHSFLHSAERFAAAAVED